VQVPFGLSIVLVARRPLADVVQTEARPAQPLSVDAVATESVPADVLASATEHA